MTTEEIINNDSETKLTCYDYGMMILLLVIIILLAIPCNNLL